MKSRLAAFVSVIAILLSAKAELTFDYQMAVKNFTGEYNYLYSIISSEFTNGTETVALSGLKIAAITNLYTSEYVWEKKDSGTSKKLSIADGKLSFATSGDVKPWVWSNKAFGGSEFGVKIVPPPGYVSYGFLYAAFSDKDSSASNLLANTNKFTISEIKSSGHPQYHIVPLIREAREFWFVDPVANTTNVIANAAYEEEGANGPIGVKLPTPKAKTGYQFQSWATESGSSLQGKEYYNPTFNLGSASTPVIVKATWTANTYTVKFNANGGSGSMADEAFTYDTAKALTANSFTRTGYTFQGWAKSSSDAKVYNDKQSVNNLTSTAGDTVTLYAKWTANSYKVKFNKNHTDATGTMANESFTYDAAKALTANGFSRTGYAFAGWATSSGGTKAYNDGQSVSNLTATAGGTVNLYAKWTANTYTVKLNQDGGSGGTASVEVTYDSAMPQITVPTRTGYTFAGYYNAMDGGGTQYYYVSGSSAKKWDTAANAELYANWKANTYTVTLDQQDGSGGLSSVKATYGKKLPTITTKPTRTGYTFGGYYTGTSGGTQYYSSAGTGVKEWTLTSGMTLYANWTANSYTVKFNANGGSGTMADESFTYDKAKALTANGFTRTGYTFQGWATSASGTKVYDDKQSVSNLTATAGGTVNLYAKWTANSYTVTFNANGGSGTMANQPFTYDTAKALTANSFTRTGYTFAGWNTKADGTGTNYTNKQSVNNLTPTAGGTVTLYAKWTANSYKVRFNRNANAATGSMDDQSFTYDTAQNLTDNGFSRPGYAFAGWNTAANGSGTTYANEQSVSNLISTDNGTVTLYAQWVANSYTVTFDATPGTVTPTSKSFAYGESYGELPEPVRTDGYIFSGWIYNYSTITATDTCSLLEDATFVASWTAPEYTITYKANDGTENSKTQNYVMNTEVMLKANTFKRTGYSFLGWALDQNAINPDYQDEESFDENDPLMIKDLTLYAVWNEISYTLQLNANNSTGNKTSQVLTYTEEYTLPLIATLGYSKTGHHFNGWGSSSGATTPLYSDGETVSKLLSVESTRNLYAIWVANAYKVTFDANGGEIDESESTKECTYGAQYGSLPTPSRVGYDFAGWKHGTNPISETTVCNLTADATLYASWTPIQYVIAFDANGGTGEMSAIEVDYDEKVTLPKSAFTAPKSIFRFAGWSETAGGDIAYLDNGVVSNLVTEAGATNTLYVVWRYHDINYALENFDLEFTIPSMYADNVDINVEDNFVEASNDGRFSTVLANAEGTLSFTWDAAENVNGGVMIWPEGGTVLDIEDYRPNAENYAISLATNIKVTVWWYADSGEGKRIKVSKVKWTPAGDEPTDGDAPDISSLSVADGVKFKCDARFNYEIWYKTDLSPKTEWKRLKTIEGTGGEVGFDLIQPGEDVMFYEIKVVGK